MERHIIVHYGEIGLKKSYKTYFVKRLINNIKSKLANEFKKDFRIIHVLSRIVIDIPEVFDEERCIKIFNTIVGIKNYKFVYSGSKDIQELSKQIFDNLPEHKDAENFCVRVKRSMVMPNTSHEMEREIGANLLKNDIGLAVRMKNPDLLVDIEFFSDTGYFSYRKHKGLGGLSPGISGKIVSLISSGIDSPVASFKMIQRGAKLAFVSFHSYPFSDVNEMEQVKSIVKILSKYQEDARLYLVPIGEIQRSISLNSDVPEELRNIIYRRLMVRIAEKIAYKEKAKAILTGDSLGQVSSQTLGNLYVTHQCSTFPLFQPLIGLDKEEIIDISEKIGTFDVSKLPCKEACTMFTPEKVETFANLEKVLSVEEKLPIDDWISSSLNDLEILRYSNNLKEKVSLKA